MLPTRFDNREQGPRRPRPGRRRFRRAAILVAVLLAGWLASEFTSRHRTDQERSRILEQTSMAAAALDPDECAALHGNPSEEQLPAYASLSAKLQAVHEASRQSRWTYLMVQRDGRVLFTADSVPPGHPDHIASGDSYEDAPEELIDVFRDGQARVVGPYQDRWGTFVSAFVPIQSADAGQPVAVLGLDVDASQWNRTIMAGRRIPLLVALVACLALVGVFIVSDRSRDATDCIARSETNLRLLMESAAEAIFLLDADTMRFRETNRACGQLFGLSREEILASGPSEISPPVQPDGRPSSEVARERIEMALQSGHASFPWVHRHRDGSPIYCDVRLTRLIAPGQRLLRASVLDTTQQVRLEREVRELQQSLHRAGLHGVANHALGEIAAELGRSASAAEASTGSLRAAFDDLDRLLNLQQRAIDAMREDRVTPELIDEVERSFRWADPIRAEIPRVLRTTRSELRSMAELAASVAPFVPPGEEARVDLNAVATSAATVSRQLWKGIAEIEFDLEQGLPPISALTTDTHLEVLGLLLKAINDLRRDLDHELGDRGTITFRTRGAASYAELAIATSRTGNPFDPVHATVTTPPLVFRAPIAEPADPDQAAA